MNFLVQVLAAPAAASAIPIMEYHDCIVAAAARLGKSGEPAQVVADRAVESCAADRRAVIGAEVRFLRGQAAYRGRSDLDAAAEAALGRLETEFRKDAEATALAAPGS